MIAKVSGEGGLRLEELLGNLARTEQELYEQKLLASQMEMRLKSVLSQKEEQIAQLSSTLQDSRNVSFVRELEEKLRLAENRLASTRRDHLQAVNDSRSANVSMIRKSLDSSRSFAAENGITSSPDKGGQMGKMIEVIQLALSEEEAGRKAAESHCEVLTYEIEKLLEANLTLKEENRALEATSEGLMRRLDAARAEELNLKAQLERRIDAQQVAEEKLDLSIAKQDEAPQKVEEFRAKNERLGFENENLRRQIGKIKSDWEAEHLVFETELVDLRKELLNLQRECRNKEEQLEQKIQERHSLEASHQTELIKIKMIYEEQLLGLKSQIERLQDRLNTRSLVPALRSSSAEPTLPVPDDHILQLEEINLIQTLDISYDKASIENLPYSPNRDSRKNSEPKPCDQDSFQLQAVEDPEALLLRNHEQVLSELASRNDEISNLRKEILALREEKPSEDLLVQLKESQLETRHLREQIDLQFLQFKEQIQFLKDTLDDRTAELVKMKSKYLNLIMETDENELKARQSIKTLEITIGLYKDQITDHNSKRKKSK